MIDRTHLLGAITALQAFNADFEGGIDTIRKGDINTALTEWFLTREDYEALDEVRKSLGKALENLNRVTLPEMMEEKDTKTITIDSLRRRFTKSLRVSCSIVEGGKNDAYEWLRANGAGALITETVNSSTLSSFAKSRVQDEGKDLPETLFKLTTMALISATKV